MFAGDTLLFFEASKPQAERVKVALDLYGSATGQSPNYNKCSMLFGQAFPATVQEQVRDALGVTSLVFEEKYLGLPTPDGRMHKGKSRCYRQV